MFTPKVIFSPIDFSAPSLEALQTAQAMAKQYGADLVIVNVIPFIPKLPEGAPIFSSNEYEQTLTDNATKKLAELAQKAEQAGVKARTKVGMANDVAMEILRDAEDEKADLIVIATHGMTGWRRLAFGSVTEKVVRTAECPVLVLRNKAAGADDKEASETKSVAA